MKGKPKKPKTPKKPIKKFIKGGFNASKYKKTHAKVFGIKEDKGMV